MSRLVAFGCSYTFGVGLPDIYPRTSGLPSDMAWPNLLGQQLNFEVCNLSSGGSGNSEILNKILQTDFEPDDLVIIMWSHFVRFDHFVCDNSNYIGEREWTWERDVLVKSNLQWHNAYKNYLTFHHAAMYLQYKRLKNMSFIAFAKDYEKYPKPNYLTIPNLYEIIGYHQDKALDNHFGVKSHKVLADILYNKLKNELR